MNLSIDTIKHIIIDQFPEFANLTIREVENNGHDNRTYHLGDEFSLRFPSAIEYSTQVIKEHQFCSILQKSISINITHPYALGKPSKYFPFYFSINKWIKGETVNRDNLLDLNQFAKDCANFLNQLHTCDTRNGPIPGTHNFFRGGKIDIYRDETISSIQKYTKFDQTKCMKILKEGIESICTEPIVWVHGDFAVGNLLINKGKLSAVIDFGSMAIGDPACDYVLAWTLFNQESRKIFLDTLNVSLGTIKRARAWALWKALISLDNPKHNKDAEYTLNQLLNDEYE